MVYAEEFTDVALMPSTVGPVATDLTGKPFEAPYCRVRPLPDAARVGVENERPFHGRCDDPIDGMVHDTVPHHRLMDHTVLGIKDMEPLVWPVPIRAAKKLCMQVEQLILHMPLERLDVGLPALAPAELPPRRKLIL